MRSSMDRIWYAVDNRGGAILSACDSIEYWLTTLCRAVLCYAVVWGGLLWCGAQMPVMDGIEATQRIHSMASEKRCVRPRIVAMTANVLHSDRQQCLSAGMDGFLSKPIRVSDLVAALEQTSLFPTPPQQQ